MNRTSISRRWFAAFVLLFAIVLAACERPLQEEPEQAPTAEATQETAPETQPEAATPQPTVPESTAPSDVATPGTGEQPSTETGEGATDVTGGEVVSADQVTYVVKAGDTLFAIAQQYNVTVEAVATANGISTDAVLDVGQTLIIPVEEATAPAEPEATAEPPTEPTDGQTGEQVHIVQAGENLFRIGLQYGVSDDVLAAYNGIPNKNRIYVGQEIRIPPSNN